MDLLKMNTSRMLINKQGISWLLLQLIFVRQDQQCSLIKYNTQGEIKFALSKVSK